MVALAIEKALAKQRRGSSPLPRPSHLRVVHDADRPVVAAEEPRQRASARLSVALSKAVAFCVVVIACVGLFWAGAGLGKLGDDFEIRLRVAEIQATAELPPPLKQIGTFNREKGGRG